MQIVKNDPRLHQGAIDAKTGKRAAKPESVQARWTFLRRRALSTRQSREKGCVIRKSQSLKIENTDNHERRKASPYSKHLISPEEVWKDGETTPSNQKAAKRSGLLGRVADAGDIGGGQPSPMGLRARPTRWRDKRPLENPAAKARPHKITSRFQRVSAGGATIPRNQNRRVLVAENDQRAKNMKILKGFKVGDHVTWKLKAGRVSGTIKAAHTRSFDYKSHTGPGFRRLPPI